MAASDFHFYTRMFSELNSTLGSYVNDTASNVIGAITPVAFTLMAIYVVLWGWSMMRGIISEPIGDAVVRVVKLATISGIALSLGYYNSFLASWLWNSPDALASYVSGGAGSPNAEYLDRLMSQMFDFGTSYYEKSQANSTLGIPDIGLIIMAFMLWGAGVLATAYGAFVLALAKIGLALTLGVGPMFILMTIFEPTKRFFDAWIGQALNYVFLVMLSAGAIKLIMSILVAYLGDATGAAADPSLDQAIPAIVFSVIATLVMIQLPGMASALGGGVALGTMGAVAWTYGQAGRGLGGAKDVASGKTLSDMRAARRRKAANADWAAANPSAARKAVGMPAAVYRKITGSGKNSVSNG